MFNYLTKFDMVAPKYDILQGGKPSYQTMTGLIVTLCLVTLSCITLSGPFFDMILKNNLVTSYDYPIATKENFSNSSFYFRISFKRWGSFGEKYIDSSNISDPPTIGGSETKDPSIPNISNSTSLTNPTSSQLTSNKS